MLLVNVGPLGGRHLEVAAVHSKQKSLLLVFFVSCGFFSSNTPFPPQMAPQLFLRKEQLLSVVSG